MAYYNSIDKNNKAIAKIKKAMEEYEAAKKLISSENDNNKADSIISDINENIKKLDKIREKIESMNNSIRVAAKRKAQEEKE